MVDGPLAILTGRACRASPPLFSGYLDASGAAASLSRGRSAAHSAERNGASRIRITAAWSAARAVQITWERMCAGIEKEGTDENLISCIDNWIVGTADNDK